MSTKAVEKFQATVEIPDKVTVTLKKSILGVEGPLGKKFQSFKKIPVNLEVSDGKVSLKAIGTRKKYYAILNTAKSLITNLCEGVLEGYTIKLKIVYAHFPITVKTPPPATRRTARSRARPMRPAPRTPSPRRSPSAPDRSRTRRRWNRRRPRDAWDRPP